jgi:hypothetical protein
VAVTAVDDDAGRLRGMQPVVFEQFDWGYNRLAAFDAESSRGGFDPPFVKTRSGVSKGPRAS